MRLTLPDVKYRNSFLKYARELREENSKNHPKEADVTAENFDKFVKHLLDNAQGNDVPEGYVPSTNYWLIDDGEVIGRASIRHELTEDLEKVGGHIGYLIRPSKRNKGYGSKILELSLPKAKELGLERALITCDSTNFASKRIIEKNGGIYENSIDQEDGPSKLRYWVSIK